MIYPLLFPKTLSEIDMKVINNHFGKYSKSIEKNYIFNDIKCELINLFNNFETKLNIEKSYLFTSKLN